MINLRRFLFSVSRPLLVCAIVALAACDRPADGNAGAEATGSDLPTVAGQAGTPAIEREPAGSIDEASPGGVAVTDGEIPQSDVPPPSRAVFSDASCDFEGWVGRKVDEAAIKATGRPSRMLTPDSMMTMDHNPDRINVVHDKDMMVTRVWCG